jgi:pseudouridine kinase
MRILASLTPAYLESHLDLFSQASLIFVDGNLSKETMRKAFSMARKANVPICADPASNSLAGRLKPHLSRLKMITPNPAQAEVLCGFTIDRSSRADALDAAKCLVSSGVEIAIIALAELGVCYATSEMSGQVPAVKTQVIDPTGGGDALTAAVIFGSERNPLDDAIRLGVAASMTQASWNDRS